jgi:hypothetical protein
LEVNPSTVQARTLFPTSDDFEEGRFISGAALKASIKALVMICASEIGPVAVKPAAGRPWKALFRLQAAMDGRQKVGPDNSGDESDSADVC